MTKEKNGPWTQWAVSSKQWKQWNDQRERRSLNPVSLLDTGVGRTNFTAQSINLKMMETKVALEFTLMTLLENMSFIYKWDQKN